MFNLQDAPTAEARMSALERFIEFWVGPRLPDCGEPTRVLSRFALPEPLRRLYHFAGRWIPPHLTRHSRFSRHMFSVQDSLLNLEDLQSPADGKLVFLAENQAVWHCATEPGGEDPPVWMSRDRENPDWEPVHPSLSQFLVGFALQELLFGSRYTVADKVSLAGLRSGLSHAAPLWKGRYVHRDPHQFSLIGTDLLVATLYGTTWVAANSERGVAKLQSVEGEIHRIHIQGPNGWCLELENDGSGELRLFLVPNTAAHFPPGTFLFADSVTRLQASITEGPAAGKSAAVFFRRGQGHAEAKPLADPTIAIDLITAAARAAIGKEPLFEAMFLKSPFYHHLKPH